MAKRNQDGGAPEDSVESAAVQPPPDAAATGPQSAAVVDKDGKKPADDESRVQKATQDHPSIVFGDAASGPEFKEKWVVIKPRKTEQCWIGKTLYQIVENQPCKVPESVKAFLEERNLC